MEQACSHIYDEVKDISSFQITTHAMSQYMAKCVLSKTLLETNQIMKEKMQEVRKIELNKKRRTDRVAFMDEDENIYITDKGKVVTVFPNRRIFVAKTIYANKKTGHKYL